MKFKMAKNSLFAVLLRSPWWISAGLTVLFVLGARALLPEKYWIAGALGTLPFVVVSAMSFWRNRNAPSTKQAQAVLDAAATMAWRDFANALVQAYEREGYAVARTDGAADLVLTRQGRTTLVAARRWKAANHGVEALQALHKAVAAQDASDSIYVTLGDLSDNASTFATKNNVQVLQGAALAKLLRALPVRAT